ncbi:hypothetical protein PFICI_07336 [Pestalotiopsis fici W106-1]|uniref:Heterokaryon incompatibility domain-containing protein n=1 Tax=Pestalotiopsis fici (strain W106-1 / CGMCC3.15140) TaxID=1229662 RepID=W3X344_PESFW|nr:uncharacterized protein PFICI_07336 [Pestalotiopsis fici W106-1]ETS79807.1 hypothetical protein PFICI_07336 [Pestalotiopsis fici W106-1]
MSGSIPPFEYEPLGSGEIRLLTPVTRESDTQVPQWRLQTVCLLDLGDGGLKGFDALSYTWGDLSETFPLVCNNQTLRVHKNLYEALPFLARRRSSQPLWIDAVCINQRDETEKLAQVRLMHRIYRQASKVWVWLGDSKECTEAAIALLPRLAQLGQTLQKSPPARWSNSHLTFASAGLPDHKSPIWEAIRAILCNDWFTRVWTVQEFALAKQVSFLCGLYEIESERVTGALMYASRLEALRDSEGRSLPLLGVSQNVGMARMQRVIALERGKHATTDVRPCPNHLIGTVYSMTLNHKCSEPKDRIWGVLGFLEEQQVARMQLKDDVNVCDLYTAFSHYIFTHTDRANNYFWCLLDRGTLDGKMAGLPSWCPDYNRLVDERTRNSISQLRSRGHEPYSASNVSSFFGSGKATSQLVLKATLFDSIQHVYPLTPLPPISIRQFAMQQLDLAVVSKLVSDLRWLITMLDDDFFSNGASSSADYDRSADQRHIGSTGDLWRTLIGNISVQSDYEITAATFSRFLASIDEFLSLARGHENMQKG